MAKSTIEIEVESALIVAAREANEDAERLYIELSNWNEIYKNLQNVTIDKITAIVVEMTIPKTKEALKLHEERIKK